MTCVGSLQLNKPNAGNTPLPWFVTALAVFGWIALFLPLADALRPQEAYSPFPRFDVLQLWLLSAMMLVAVDTFRAKAGLERVFWAVAASFWLVEVLIEFAQYFGYEWIGTFAHYYLINELMHIASSLTVLLVTPLYVLFLSYAAIRAWFLKLTR